MTESGRRRPGLREGGRRPFPGGKGHALPEGQQVKGPDAEGSGAVGEGAAPLLGAAAQAGLLHGVDGVPQELVRVLLAPEAEVPGDLWGRKQCQPWGAPTSAAAGPGPCHPASPASPAGFCQLAERQRALRKLPPSTRDRAQQRCPSGSTAKRPRLGAPGPVRRPLRSASPGASSERR